MAQPTAPVVVLPIVLVFLLASSAQGAPIWGLPIEPEDLAGTRDSHVDGVVGAFEGVTATGPWDEGGFTISWRISKFDVSEFVSIWTYEYTIETTRKDVSHFILEVTDDSIPFLLLDGTDDLEGPRTYTEGPGNPELPQDIFGVKFDFGGTDAKYTIVTNRSPVYGVFYAKNGKDAGDDVVAYSDALDSGDYMTNGGLSINAFIARPDSDADRVIPEPCTFALFGIAAGAGFLRNRRRKV